MAKRWRQIGGLIVIFGGVFLIIIWQEYIFPIFPAFDIELNEMLLSPIIFGTLATASGFLMMNNKSWATIIAFISGVLPLIITLVLFYRIQYWGEPLELVSLGYYFIWMGAIVIIIGSITSAIKSDVERIVLLILSLIFSSAVGVAAVILLIITSFF
jgi:hypothetical protein